MLDHAHRVGFHIFGEIRFFDLAKHAFVKRPVGFRLPGQFLITNGCFIQGESRFFLFTDGRVQIPLCGVRLGKRVAECGRLGQNSATQSVSRFSQGGAGRHHLWMFILVALGKCGHGRFQLAEITAPIVHGRGSGNARDRKQCIDIIADSFDLL